MSAIYHAKRRPMMHPRDSIRPGEMDYGYDSPNKNGSPRLVGHDDGVDTPTRRMSGSELISMKGFVSGPFLAAMQKQLCEMAQDVPILPPMPLPPFQPPSAVHHTRSFNAGSAAVGPLAIACEKFEER